MMIIKQISVFWRGLRISYNLTDLIHICDTNVVTLIEFG